MQKPAIPCLLFPAAQRYNGAAPYNFTEEDVLGDTLGLRVACNLNVLITALDSCQHNLS